MTEIKKRRGRPPKNAAQVEQVPKRRGRPPKHEAKIEIDWHTLAKRLQDALESQIEENKVLINAKAEVVRMAHDLEKQVVGLEAVVNVLEAKLDRAHNSV